MLLYAGVILADSTVLVGLPEPPRDATGEQLAAYWAAKRLALQVGSYVGLLGVVCFLFFLGSLWAALRRAEGAPGALSAVALGAGFVTTALLLAAGGPATAAYQQAAQTGHLVDPVEALTLRHISFGLLQHSWFSDAAMLLAAAPVALRAGVMPRWLAWGGVLTAVTLLATRAMLAADPAWLGWIYVQALFGLWVAATSVILMRGAAGSTPGAAPEQPTAGASQGVPAARPGLRLRG